uniref:Secreted protein n=1 Tax=Romanomermis culicivorax TaxID=13658 RepID=A0A915IAJ8_ROMCU
MQHQTPWTTGAMLWSPMLRGFLYGTRAVPPLANVRGVLSGARAVPPLANFSLTVTILTRTQQKYPGSVPMDCLKHQFYG